MKPTRLPTRHWLGPLLGGVLLSNGVNAAPAQPVDSEPDSPDLRPNILLIVADDLGWSDLGSFGSEIHTPSLDALAQRGTTMTQFRVAPTCSPTRAMLLTGVDNHLAGVGTMEYIQTPNQRESIYYAAELQAGVTTVAEVLKEAGYATVMAGKWHLAQTPANYPDARGFEQSFALLQGGASHFADRLPLHAGYRVDYLENGEPVNLPNNFYSSISYTDKLLEYLGALEGNQPFFAYLAYTAPHDPLQVPDAWLDRYSGRYDAGPEVIRSERAQRQKALGLLSENAEPWTAPDYPSWLPSTQPAWEARDPQQRQRDARPMELYAAMIELMDQQIGRVLSWLDQHNELDNTYILFMSDNGANAATPLLYPHTSREWLLSERAQSLADMGKAGSHTFLGREWASTANTPLALYKATVADGGIRVPLIVSGPGVATNQRSTTPAHVTDITPTLLEMAAIDLAAAPAYDDNLRPQGNSLVPVWAGQEAPRTRPQGTELFGNSALVDGDWKARKMNIPIGSGQWELFNIAEDPGETTNLATQYPARLAEMISSYDSYAAASGVIIPDPPPMPSSSVLYAGPCDWWCSVRFAVVDTLIAIRSFFNEE